MNNIYGIIISISLLITTIFLVSILRKKPKSQLQQIFSVDMILLFVLSFFILMQILLSEPLNIPPIYFDYFAYICACYFPVSIFFTSLIFANTKIKFKKRYILLFIIPTLSLLVLWTNDIHHLFYETYSVNLNETVFGSYFPIHSFYSYFFIFVGIVYLLYYSIKNSGFFSKQSLLISIGTLISVVANVLATFGIISSTIYITPITFVATVSCYYLATFKFQFLGVAPIALQRIVDRISDAYLIINEENIITDFNKTFLTMFHIKTEETRNCNIFTLIDKLGETNIDKFLLSSFLEQVKHSSQTLHFEKEFSSIKKYFNIEINDIKSKNSYLGTLILLKDVTQHIEDMNTIKNKQNLLMEKERLASLGQLIGGIAHNLKTPIMSISGASEGLTDLVKEYDSSIGDPEVNEQDHHEIAHDMSEWIERIKTHTSYMSDIITAVKGQAVALSEEEEDTFTIDELIKRVNILMRHELKNALVELQIKLNTSSIIPLCGNVNGLVQVINNMISNAIQSYKGEPNKKIDLIISRQDNNVVFSIQDYGCGMSQEVKDKLFKEMITTKGKNGTGLGLFMSYSTIRGHFNGNITFDSELGKGTKFNIILPCQIFQS